MGHIRTAATHTAKATDTVYLHVQLRQVSHARAVGVGTYPTNDPLHL